MEEENKYKHWIENGMSPSENYYFPFFWQKRDWYVGRKNKKCLEGYFLSPPVRMQGGLICIAFCMSVTRTKFIPQEPMHLEGLQMFRNILYNT